MAFLQKFFEKRQTPNLQQYLESTHKLDRGESWFNVDKEKKINEDMEESKSSCSKASKSIISFNYILVEKLL